MGFVRRSDDSRWACGFGGFAVGGFGIDFPDSPPNMPYDVSFLARQRYAEKRWGGPKELEEHPMPVTVRLESKDRTSLGEQIYFALSQDGRNWTALNQSKPVLVSDVGKKGAWAPYLIRGRKPHHVNDTTMIRDGNTYDRFSKDE
jgi:hypothetical protein